MTWREVPIFPKTHLLLPTETQLERECTDKADANPNRKHRRPHTNHVEALVTFSFIPAKNTHIQRHPVYLQVYPCRVYVNIREFVDQGEGAVSNVQQVIDIVSELERIYGRIPLNFMIDDVSVSPTIPPSLLFCCFATNLNTGSSHPIAVLGSGLLDHHPLAHRACCPGKKPAYPPFTIVGSSPTVRH